MSEEIPVRASAMIEQYIDTLPQISNKGDSSREMYI